MKPKKQKGIINRRNLTNLITLIFLLFIIGLGAYCNANQTNAEIETYAIPTDTFKATSDTIPPAPRRTQRRRSNPTTPTRTHDNRPFLDQIVPQEQPTPKP